MTSREYGTKEHFVSVLRMRRGSGSRDPGSAVREPRPGGCVPSGQLALSVFTLHLQEDKMRGREGGGSPAGAVGRLNWILNKQFLIFLFVQNRYSNLGVRHHLGSDVDLPTCLPGSLLCSVIFPTKVLLSAHLPTPPS